MSLQYMANNDDILVCKADIFILPRTTFNLLSQLPYETERRRTKKRIANTTHNAVKAEGDRES